MQLEAGGITVKSARDVVIALKYPLVDPACTAARIAARLRSRVGYRRRERHGGTPRILRQFSLRQNTNCQGMERRWMWDQCSGA